MSNNSSSETMKSVGLILYLEYFQLDKNYRRVSIETFVVLLVLKFVGCLLSNERLRFVFVLSSKSPPFGSVTIKNNIKYEDIPTPKIVAKCRLPVLYIEEDSFIVIAGFCSVLRKILIEQSNGGNRLARSLLGYQCGCLSAPAEVSPWTRFCEVQLPTATSLVLMSKPHRLHTCMPYLSNALNEFELNLSKPVRMHNIRRRMQQFNKESGYLVNTSLGHDDPIKVFAKTNHLFAEGPDLLLSDLIIFANYFAIFQNNTLPAQLPLTQDWYIRLKCMCISTVSEIKVIFEESFSFIVECTPVGELKRRFTSQSQIERIFRFVDEISDHDAISRDGEEIVADCFDWSQLPLSVHPQGGDLPMKRLSKKCGQLSSMIALILDLVRKNQKDQLTIVDFCSGGGHLGILLAFLLPQATIFLIENKTNSLMRAVRRVGFGSMKPLHNISFIQSNLDYFVGSFDIGCALHACGIATDLVIQKCVESRADFVCCPCCYGSIRENHLVEYPRSKKFGSLSLSDYLILAHAADQTDSKEAQGRQAMLAIDNDRASFAVEAGYRHVFLTSLKPLNCSPKNNVIVGSFIEDLSI